MTEPDYPYPPLVPEDPDELARRMAAHLGDAWDEALDDYRRVLDSAQELRKAETLAALEDLLGSIARFQDATLLTARPYALEQLPAIYGAAAQAQAPGFSWTDLHLETVQALSADSYDDLLRRSVEAGRTSQRFAKEVRAVARSRTGFAVTGRKTATQVGQDLRKRLEARGISVATYANGARVPMRAYTEMVVQTKTGVAHNLGSLRGMGDAGVEWVEVLDGADCGWRSHKDPDKANGTIRRAREAEAFLLSHPNCRRAFGARPDVETAAQARSANPSTTSGERADQAQSEGPAGVAANSRAEARIAARGRLAEKRAARAARDPLTGYDLESMTDEALEQLAALDAVIADEAALSRVYGELDRRDELAAAAQVPPVPAPRSVVEVMTTGARSPAEEQLLAAYFRDMEAKDAAARAIRQDVIPAPRRQTPAQRAREELEVHLEQLVLSAEQATRGALFSAEGRRANVSERTLFEGDPRQAVRYASEELRAYWRDNPNSRVTWLQYRSPDSPRARVSRQRFRTTLDEYESKDRRGGRR